MSRDRPLFLAIDAGTGGGKCMLLDAGGRRLAVHRQPWSYQVSVNPEIPFVKEFEFNGPEFWGILCRCIRDAVREANVEPGRIAGIASTSQREGCVFLDGAGREIYAGPNLDARGFNEGLEVMERLGPARLYEITGHSAPFIFPIARYLWHRKQQRPPVARLLMINDWIAYRLTGAFAGEPSNGTESMLFDLRARAWSDEILDLFDIPRGILPAIHASGARIGEVSAVAAAETGLAPGTPVFTGGADTQCSLLGAGVSEPGQVGATLGTTTPVQMVVGAPTFDPRGNLWAGCHVLPDRWVLESNAGDTGDAYLWILRLIGGDQKPERLFQLGEELGRAETAPQVFSFLGPSIFNMMDIRPDKPGGILFHFPMMHHRPDHADLMRSFLDSIGFAIRANCEQISAVTGVPPTSLTLSGGLSRSAALVQRVANIAGIPVVVGREPESAALGCAVLVAAGVGTYESIAAAARGMVAVSEVLPHADAHDRYEPLYAKWRELYQQMEQLSL